MSLLLSIFSSTRPSKSFHVTHCPCPIFRRHHDFPSIPWTRLPKLRQIASEYYDPLPRHHSWPMVTFRFIFQTDVGLFSRAKRSPGGPHQKLVKEEDKKSI